MATTKFGALQEVALGKRFGFGANWKKYSKTIDKESMQKSKESLLKMMQLQSLSGKSFLDIGSGSGLSSLSAKLAHAERIYSFDFDPNSVECTKKIKEQFAPNDKNWFVGQGSVLDKTFMQSLGTFDCVYSWGVLHHTGNMQLAFENVADTVSPNGNLFISIYNDQGTISQIWLAVKKTYNALPRLLRPLFALLVILPVEFRSFVIHALRGQPGAYIGSWFTKQERGMNRFYDWIDWIGGYPFEVAKPEVIFDFFSQRGFILQKMKTCAGGLGCNEFVFKKIQRDAP